MWLQVRGATTHYEAVVNSATGGSLSAGLESGVPVIFGVLTTENMEQVFYQRPMVTNRIWPSSIRGLRQYNGTCPFPKVVVLHCLSCDGKVVSWCLMVSANLYASRSPPMQALDRAGGKVGNKGFECAVTAIEVANLMKSLRQQGLAAEAWGTS